MQKKQEMKTRNNRPTWKDKTNNNKMGLRKGTEIKGAEKSRDQRNRKNSSIEAEKKDCDSPDCHNPGWQAASGH